MCGTGSPFTARTGNDEMPWRTTSVLGTTSSARKSKLVLPNIQKRLRRHVIHASWCAHWLIVRITPSQQPQLSGVCEYTPKLTS